MAQCACVNSQNYPYYPYYYPYFSPYQYWTQGVQSTAAYNPLYYGLPYGYVYTNPTPLVLAGYPRGEYRVGSCHLICQ